MAQVKLLITDFDGTLVDTFEANFLAYQKAFAMFGLELTEQQYRDCFGFRFDDFMSHMGINDNDTKNGIRLAKGDFYPLFFDKLIVNDPLLTLLKTFKNSGGLTAVASTARKENLMNALNFINAADAFSLILTGEDVKQGKPNPAIYNKVLETLNVLPAEALIFEDSSVGISAANAAYVDYVQITKEYFYGNTGKRA
jgi:beta-phosphoglucomutase